MTIYVKLRRGGYQQVDNFNNLLYDEQDVYSGWYRDTGWIPQQLSVYTYSATPTDDVLNNSRITPATGNNATPDEQAGQAPRELTWKETRMNFRDSSNNILAQFLARDVVGWSDTAPNTDA
jgi:hypothetical protein